MNSDILGTAIYAKVQELNNKTPDEIGNVEEARLQFWKDVAGEIITHIQTLGVVNTTGTAAAQTGKLT